MLLMIDEISLVSRTLIFQMNLWLIKRFGVNKPFGGGGGGGGRGLSVIVCGDFYQLPLVNPPAIYS